jgi:hypothetical protein
MECILQTVENLEKCVDEINTESEGETEEMAKLELAVHRLEKSCAVLKIVCLCLWLNNNHPVLPDSVAQRLREEGFTGIVCETEVRQMAEGPQSEPVSLPE